MSSVSLTVQSVEASPATGIAAKYCSKCDTTKPVTEFHKDRRRKDGLKWLCRPCSSKLERKYYEASPERVNERKRKWADANREKVREQSRKWKKANPEKVRESARKYYKANPEKMREKARKYYEASPEKHIQSVRKYQKANPERVKERKRKYYEANPEKSAACDRRRRARKQSAEGSHTAEQWLARKEEYNNSCAYCGIHESDLASNGHASFRVLHADHIHPLSKGGSDDISNIVPACGSCNCSKGDKWIGEFLYGKDRIGVKD